MLCAWAAFATLLVSICGFGLPYWYPPSAPSQQLDRLSDLPGFTRLVTAPDSCIQAPEQPPRVTDYRKVSEQPREQPAHRKHRKVTRIVRHKQAPATQRSFAVYYSQEG